MQLKRSPFGALPKGFGASNSIPKNTTRAVQHDLFDINNESNKNDTRRPNLSGNTLGLKPALKSDINEDVFSDFTSEVKAKAKPEEKKEEISLLEIAGRVERVIFQTADGYAVYSLRMDNRKTTTVSVTSHIKAKKGDKIIARGQWSKYKGKETFKAAFIMMDIPQGAMGVVAWLKMGSAPGVGKATAEKIAKFFGDDILDAIVDPKKLVESGITMRRAEAIAEAWNNNASQPELIEFLGRFGLGEMTIAKIIKRYGAAARRVIETRPWELTETIDGVGFNTTDEIAMQAGHEKDSPARLQYGVRYALEQKTGREGHCGLPREELLAEAVRILKVDTDLIEEALLSAINDENIINDENTGLLYLWPMYSAEKDLAKRLLDMIKFGAQVPEERARDAVEKAIIDLKVNRDQGQVDAAIMAIVNPVSIITGGGNRKVNDSESHRPCVQTIRARDGLSGPYRTRRQKTVRSFWTPSEHLPSPS